MKNNRPSIDVVTNPGIILPPGMFSEAQRIDDVLKKADEGQENRTVPSEPENKTPEDSKPESSSIPTESREQKKKNLFDEMKDRQNSDSVGWVQKNEVELAKKHIRECLGFDPPPMCGNKMAVIVFEEEFSRDNEGKKSSIILPGMVSAEQKYRNCTGLVVSQSADCYSSPKYNEHWFIRFLRIFFNPIMKKPVKKPLCRVGDWIMFYRNSSWCVLENYRGYPMFFMYEDNVVTPVEDPSYVKRY